MTYSDFGRQVYEEDIVKAIKFQLNNEEEAWKKQSNELNKIKDGIYVHYDISFRLIQTVHYIYRN